MNVEMREEQETDTSVLLKNLGQGDVFHFATDTLQDAFKEDIVYMVVSGGKESRTQIVNISDGLLLQRDDCHRVHKLYASMVVDA